MQRTSEMAENMDMADWPHFTGRSVVLFWLLRDTNEFDQAKHVESVLKDKAGVGAIASK